MDEPGAHVGREGVMGKSIETVARVWELFETGRYDQLGEVFADPCEFEMPGVRLTSPDAIGPYVKAWWDAFPDLQHTIVGSVESGDTIATELRIVGTHTRPMQGPGGEIPATGRRVAFASCDYIRVVDGKVVSWHA